MKTYRVDVLVVGAGPAGLGAAARAREEGAKDVLVLERDFEPGGILNQCIHSGFGVQTFGEELTGPEYAARYIKKAGELGVDVELDTMVLDITPDLKVYGTSRQHGPRCFQAKSIILAMGCRERTRDAVQIPGDRPAGIFTAGTAQRYTNIEGFLPGRDVVILGSGDIGLIMARRMHLEGCRVRGVYEILPYTNGLTRNVAQCLNDFDIPLKLKHTITAIHGKDRVRRVTVAEVDEHLHPVHGTEQDIECDTVLLSVGLIPENELTKRMKVELDDRTGGAIVDEARMTSIPGVFSCGNVLQVHDLVDNVTVESEIAGLRAARFVAEGSEEKDSIAVKPGSGIRYVVPQRISWKAHYTEKVDLYMRSTKPYRGVDVVVAEGDQLIARTREAAVKPGEMIKLTLKPGELNSLQGRGDLEVSIVKEG